MKFRSILNDHSLVSFREALFRGIAPDGSLYVPEAIPTLPAGVKTSDATQSLPRVAAQVLSAYIEEISSEQIQKMADRAFSFPIPLVKLEDDLYLLELFHGPTLAFKDVGARFMAAALSYFLEQEQQELTIAVATSGDTGSAVAQGFVNVPHISVFVLYPSGKISTLQEQQITTVGGNIHAIEVEGTFDDCQHLVKTALADQELVRACNLTTANSINLGRLIPQITYYVWGLMELQRQTGRSPNQEIAADVCVPSGNFGNLTAAAYAKRMGVPIARLFSASNANVVVPEFFRTGSFRPRPSVQTFSNAMDVGNPSNFARLQALYEGNLDAMKSDIASTSVLDEETLVEMQRTYERSGYILDPHTAVGVAATRKLKPSHSSSRPTIVVGTAHPAKFPEVVEKALHITTPLPKQLQEALQRTKQSTRIPADYQRVKRLLLA
ncbi:MAG: threonine synthase [Ignavibacteriales bacterium]|nr:threonine synthase [Ignavibacteriales bacterium]